MNPPEQAGDSGTQAGEAGELSEQILETAKRLRNNPQLARELCQKVDPKRLAELCRQAFLPSQSDRRARDFQRLRAEKALHLPPNHLHKVTGQQVLKNLEELCQREESASLMASLLAELGPETAAHFRAELAAGEVAREASAEPAATRETGQAGSEQEAAAEVEFGKKQRRDLERLRRQRQEDARTIEKLQRKNDELKRQFDRLARTWQKKLAESQNGKTLLKGRSEEQEQTIRDLKDRLSRLEAQLSTARSDKERHELRSKELQKQNAGLEAEAQKLRENLEQVRSRLERAREEQAKLTTQLKQRERLADFPKALATDTEKVLQVDYALLGQSPDKRLENLLELYDAVVHRRNHPSLERTNWELCREQLQGLLVLQIETLLADLRQLPIQQWLRSLQFLLEGAGAPRQPELIPKNRGRP